MCILWTLFIAMGVAFAIAANATPGANWMDVSVLVVNCVLLFLWGKQVVINHVSFKQAQRDLERYKERDHVA